IRGFAGGLSGVLGPMGRLAGAMGLVGGAAGFIGLARRTDEFNQAMNRSLAIIPGVSSEMRESMRQTALMVGLQNNLKVSAKEAAESYYFLAAAGKSAEQSQALLADVLTFAQAGNFDAALATDLLT